MNIERQYLKHHILNIRHHHHPANMEFGHLLTCSGIPWCLLPVGLYFFFF